MGGTGRVSSLGMAIVLSEMHEEGGSAMNEGIQMLQARQCQVVADLFMRRNHST